MHSTPLSRRSPRRTYLTLLPAAFLISHATPSFAQVFTWNGAASVNNFSVAAGLTNNWGGIGPIPTAGLATTDLIFAGSTRLTPSAEVNYAIRSITFSAGAGAFNLSGPGNLALGSGGITQNAANPQSLSNRLSLAANQTWNITAGNLNLNNNVDLAANDLILSAAPTRTVTFSGLFAGTSASSLTVDGGGTVTLAGTSSFAGTLALNAGTLRINSTARLPSLGSLTIANAANIILDGGTVTPSGALELGKLAGSNNTLTINSGQLTLPKLDVGDQGTATVIQSGGTVTVTESLINLTVGSVFATPSRYLVSGGTVNSSDLFIYGNATFEQSGGTVNITDLLGVGFAFNNTSLAQYLLTGGTLNTGTLNLNSDSPATFRLNGGTLNATSARIGDPTANPSQQLLIESGNLTATSIDLDHGTITHSGGTVSTTTTELKHGTYTQTGGLHTAATSLVLGDESTSVAAYNLAGGILATPAISATLGTTSFTIDGGTLRAPSSTTISFTGIVPLIAPGGVSIDSNGFNVTIATILSPRDASSGVTGGGLTKLGTGTLTLTANNTYTGPTTVLAGILSIPSNAALGIPSSPVSIHPGARLLFTSSSTTSRTFTLYSGTLQTAPSTTLTFSGATVAGGNIGPGGTYLLANNTTLANSTTLAGALLSQPSGSSTLSAVTLRGSLTQSPGATLNLPDTWLTASAIASLSGTSAASGVLSDGTLTLTPGARLTHSLTNLTLSASSRTTLTPGSTLTASPGTAIDLSGLLTNNGTQSGTLNILYGGTAKGAGTFGTINLLDGGTFSPGNSPAAISSSTSTWEDGGTYTVELLDALGAPGTAFDQWNIAGDLLISSGSTPNSVFTLSLISLSSPTTSGLTQNFIPGRPYAWPILTTTGTITGFSPTSILLDTSSFQNDLFGGSLTLSATSTTLFLTFTPPPIPEPTSLSLLILPLLCLRRPRRYRHS